MSLTGISNQFTGFVFIATVAANITPFAESRCILTFVVVYLSMCPLYNLIITLQKIY